ncbi:MAG: histidine phosphotransferase family protein [Alphaproteobacteria bacterium]|nr:histidine phosphotransferase family protein [Alphaproteobacteria bacterium]
MDTSNTKLLELLASKICHDLISPVGAIANGVEFLTDMGEDSGDEITDLIAYSSSQASAKLKAMRLAYGFGGADQSIKAEDVHKIFSDFIAGESSRLSHDWDPHSLAPPVIGSSKMLMCGLMLVAEGLPKGGEIKVIQEDAQTVKIFAKGENAGLRDGLYEALKQQFNIDDLQPKHAHAALFGLMAKNYGYSLYVDETEANTITLKISTL